MHIPDNYLSPSTCAVMAIAVTPVLVHSVKKVKKDIPREKIPLLGIGAAFSFLLMMFNVPLPGGTTGHAVGGTLIALLLGPEAAFISVSIALFIQALLFGDGGILAFGANVFNMAFILPFTGYYTCNFIKRKIKSELGEKIGIIVGAYVGLNLASLITAIEFGIQPILFKDSFGNPMYCPYGLSISIPAMVLPHLILAGVVEAAFTFAIYSFIKRTSKEIIYKDSEEKVKYKPLLILLGVLVLLTPLGLLSEGTAWGEWGIDEISKVSESGTELGFIPKGMENGFDFTSLMPDYEVGSILPVFGYILAAIIGTTILIIIFKIIGSLKRDINNG